MYFENTKNYQKNSGEIFITERKPQNKIFEYAKTKKPHKECASLYGYKLRRTITD